MQKPSNLGVAQENVSIFACRFDYLLNHTWCGHHESNVQLYLSELQISRVNAAGSVYGGCR